VDSAAQPASGLGRHASTQASVRDGINSTFGLYPAIKGLFDPMHGLGDKILAFLINCHSNANNLLAHEKMFDSPRR
jgi:hypothetical protein